MNRIISVSFLITFLSYTAFAQLGGMQFYSNEGTNGLTGGMGISWITENGKTVPYYTLTLMPDLSFGKFGVGLDLNLRINSQDGTIRKVDWADGAYRKIIRYVRWGHKHDPLYVRLGALDMATLGHGFIMSYYSNSPGLDDRRIGAEFDVDFNKFGFETVYGDFQQAGLIGGRGYVRPLKFTTLAGVPVIGGFEIGATYVTDQNPNSGVLIATYNRAAKTDSVIKRTDKISEFGFDAGLPLLRIPFVDMDIYYDYATIINFGHGSAVGLKADFNSLGLVTASVKVERQFLGDRFIPEYFDQFYELERYTPASSPFVSKAAFLDSVKGSNGWYGQLIVALMQNFKIIGFYRGLDNDSTGGLMHLETRFPNVLPTFVFSAGYDRTKVKNFGDLFKLDEHSLLYAFLGYKPYPFMTIGMNYYWTFIPENGSYSVQKRVEPRIMFNFVF
ncbi:MAG: hypothetical protein ACP5MI_09765 [Candidatus Kryptoniota bacterium]